MTVKVLSIDTTFGKVNPVPVESGQQEQWVDVMTAADVASILESASYEPTITSSGAGTVASIGFWSAHRVDTEVVVVGSLSFIPAVAGVAESLTITLPTGTTMAPLANFGAVTDLTGIASMAGPVPATDGSAGPRAVVAAKTASLLGLVANGTREIGVTLRYKTK